MAALMQSELSAPLPEPVGDYQLFDGSVRVLAFGKPEDWSLRPYNRGGSLVGQGNLAPSKYIPKIAIDYGLAKTLYSPSSRLFNAEVCTESDCMGYRVALESKLYHNTVWLLRGADADGVLLARGHEYVVSPAGCPVVVIYHPHSKLLGVAHAGMRSLIDEGRLKGEAKRTNESIVLGLVEAMQSAGAYIPHLRAQILFPNDPRMFTYPWDHPVYGTLNQKRTEELVSLWGPGAVYEYENPAARKLGRPDLMAIIASQLHKIGAPSESVSVVGSPNADRWHDTRQEEANPMARNLVIVQHLQTPS